MLLPRPVAIFLGPLFPFLSRVVTSTERGKQMEEERFIIELSITIKATISLIPLEAGAAASTGF